MPQGYYNSTGLPIINTRGKKHTEKWKQEMREKMFGNDWGFEKGHTPWCAGTKGLMKPNKGSFQKGSSGFNRNHTEETKSKMRGRKISDEVKDKMKAGYKYHINGGCFKREDLLGDKHWNWKGGITPLNKTIRNSFEYDIWRFSVFEYDNYTCWICETRGVKLHAHHLWKFSQYPELRFVRKNGITLCKFCHITYTDFGNKK